MQDIILQLGKRGIKTISEQEEGFYKVSMNQGLAEYINTLEPEDHGLICNSLNINEER